MSAERDVAREFIREHLDEPDRVARALNLAEHEANELVDMARQAFAHPPYVAWLERQQS